MISPYHKCYFYYFLFDHYHQINSQLHQPLFCLLRELEARTGTETFREPALLMVLLLGLGFSYPRAVAIWNCREPFRLLTKEESHVSICPSQATGWKRDAQCTKQLTMQLSEGDFLQYIYM